MKNKLVFTQDVPGEREWLNRQFPGYVNLETQHSGLWHTATEQGCIFEVAYSDQIPNLHCETYKSVYSPAVGLIDQHWWLADHVVSNLNFSNTHNAQQYQAVTFGRSGTVFTESLLSKKYKKLSNHYTSSDATPDGIAELIKNENTVVALVYRNNWWEWITSTLIAKTYGFYHFSNQPNWNQIDPIAVTAMDLDQLYAQFVSTWNFFCNLRVMLPDRLFYLLEFSNMIEKYRDCTSHKKVNYNKKDLISNHDAAKTHFDSTCLDQWNTVAKRCTGHLTNMGCLIDFEDVVHI